MFSLKKAILLFALGLLCLDTFAQVVLDDSGSTILRNSTPSGQWAGSTRLSLCAGPNQDNGFIFSYEADSNPRVGRLSLGNNWGGIYGDFAISLRNYSSSAAIERFRIKYNGNVGIGTDDPKAKLDVAGNIKAEEIEVTLASMQDLNLNGTLAANNITYTANGQTADHVFEDDYNLKSLDEIEVFILENKHLPDVPSAEAMEEEGVHLAEMNKLLLKKVGRLNIV
nr:hypothetical protein [uncultured Carboxylicivirga sp.]